MSDVVMPRGWIQAEIGELCDLINGRAFKPTEWSDKGLPIIRIQNLNNSNAPFNHFDGELADKHRIQYGDLLFAWSGTPGTSFGAHVWKGDEAALNQHIFKVGFDESRIDKRFLRYAINQTLDELVAGAHGGVGLRHVTKGKFEKTRVAFPARGEQKAIADKLDELLAQVNNLKARLDAIPTILKRFRQSVLQAAVSGRLNEASQETRVFKKVKVGDEVVEIPHGWSISNIGAVIDGSRKLCYGVVQPGGEVPGGVPLIRVCDIHEGEVNEVGLRTISFDVDDRYKRSKVKRGDVVVTVVGAIGRVGVIRADIDANIARAVARISPDESLVYPMFVHRWLSSPVMQWWLVNSSKEVARKTLNLKELKAAPIPLPSLEEQAEIVRRVDQLFAFADQIEQQVANAQARVNKLTQSILAKAFRGELTAEWRAENPELISGEHSAEALLERIKAEKAKQKPARTRRGDRKVTVTS